MEKNSYAVYVVFADGNPQAVGREFTAGEAIASYRVTRAKYPGTPPFVGIIDENDEEKGWYDDDRLEDEILGY